MSVAFAVRRRRLLRPAAMPYGMILGVLSAAVLASVVIATGIGPVRVPSGEVARILAHHLSGGGDTAATADLIVWRLRFPRVLLGALVGTGLALAGAVVQSVVRNPVADPYLLGLSSGASVGAVLVITTGAMTVVLLLARHRGRLVPLRLILVGVACGHLLSGFTSFMLTRAETSSAQQQIVFWLLGALSGANWSLLAAPAVVVACSCLLLLFRARRLNVLVLGDEACAALGVNASRLRLELLLLTTLLVGTVVAVSGGIGFVGLIVAHLARMLVGADHRRMLPIAAALGALFLVWADVAARMLIAHTELPIGILTAFLGVPFFLLVLHARGLAAEGAP